MTIYINFKIKFQKITFLCTQKLPSFIIDLYSAFYHYKDQDKKEFEDEIDKLLNDFVSEFSDFTVSTPKVSWKIFHKTISRLYIFRKLQEIFIDDEKLKDYDMKEEKGVSSHERISKTFIEEFDHLIDKIVEQFPKDHVFMGSRFLSTVMNQAIENLKTASEKNDITSMISSSIERFWNNQRLQIRKEYDDRLSPRKGLSEKIENSNYNRHLGSYFRKLLDPHGHVFYIRPENLKRLCKYRNRNPLFSDNYKFKHYLGVYWNDNSDGLEKFPFEERKSILLNELISNIYHENSQLIFAFNLDDQIHVIDNGQVIKEVILQGVGDLDLPEECPKFDSNVKFNDKIIQNIVEISEVNENFEIETDESLRELYLERLEDEISICTKSRKLKNLLEKYMKESFNHNIFMRRVFIYFELIEDSEIKHYYDTYYYR